MRYEAGMSRNLLHLLCRLADLVIPYSPLVYMTVTITHLFRDAFDIVAASRVVSLFDCNCILSVDMSISTVTSDEVLLLQRLSR